MNVLILTVPSAEGADLVEMRDFVLESLELGVLILGLGGAIPLPALPARGPEKSSRSWTPWSSTGTGRAWAA